MKRTFKGGLYQYEILPKDFTVLDIRDSDQAFRLLSSCNLDSAQLVALHNEYHSDLKITQSADAKDLLNGLARWLVKTHAKILRSPMLARSGSVEAEVGQKTRHGGEGQLPKAQGKKSWIEINLCDENGRPVPMERYRIKLPDGSVEEGNLDAYGHAEYYGINPGSCELSFPNLHPDEWTRV